MTETEGKDDGAREALISFLLSAIDAWRAAHDLDPQVADEVRTEVERLMTREQNRDRAR